MVGSTALQIYFNPDDLVVFLGKEKSGDDFWGVLITRGPRIERHPFIALISSNEGSRLTKEKALEFVETVLRSAKKFGDEVFTNSEYKLLRVLACGLEILSKQEYVASRGPVLEDADIERVMAELRVDLVDGGAHSETFNWDDWGERYPKQEVHG